MPTIADTIVDSLRDAGVTRIYGLPGDSLNGFTDALRRDGSIAWQHVRHEEAAAFAAAADAGLTGELAVCAGSCGPGNTHLVNGLYDANRSRVPVLAIAAQIPGPEIGSTYFQETHPQELFREASVYTELVSIPEQLPHVAAVGIPGPHLGRVGSMRSPQTLSEADRRLVAAWAADCAERVLPIFERAAPDDGRPRALIARARAFADGELDTAAEIRRRFAGGVGAGEVTDPAAMAAARAAGQAVGIAHMGAHALGAAGYAVQAAVLAAPDAAEATAGEIRWQLDHMTDGVRAALRTLPRVGEDLSGPLGRGLLASGRVGAAIRELQTALASCRPA